jgi:HSP20 family protein
MDHINPGNNEQNKIPKWALALIVLLVVLFFMQSGIILYQALHKEDAHQYRKTAPHVTQLPAGPFTAQASSPVSRHRGTMTRQAPAQNPFYQAPQTQVQSAAAQDPFAAMRQDPFFDDAFFSLGRLTQQMSQLFENMGGMGPMDSSFMPAVDMEETKNAYIVRSDIPGLDKDKIDVSVHGNLLTLRGVRETGSEHKDDRSGYYSQERSYGSFSRSMMLPGPVDESKITADYKNGVLTVTLPKSEPDKGTNKIAVT